MNRYLAMLLFVFVVSCGKNEGGPSLLEELNPSISIDDPVPLEAETFKVNIKYINFTQNQKEKYEEAIEIVKKVVASDEFKYQVLNFSFIESNGKSNGAIYLNILNGSETLQPAYNNQMDVEVELYSANNTTIGFTYPNTKRIWVNTKYFDDYSPAEVAGNLFHEWLHKLGFNHAVSYSASRDYSVPYAIGRMVRILGSQF